MLRTGTLTGQSLWRDEVDAIRFSSWSPWQLVSGLFQVGHNGPLFFLLLRPWRDLTGNSEFALRYPSALLGTLAIPLGFVLARQLGFSRRAGLLLGLLLATSPYLVWYGQEAKMYALLVVLITLAFIAYLKALTDAGRPPGLGGCSLRRASSKRGWSWGWWLIFVTTTSLSFYTHILSPLMLLVYGGVALLYQVQLRRHWRGWLISMACLTLPYLPLALWQVPLLLQGFQSGHPFYSLQDETFLLLQLYSSGLIRFAGLTAIILFVFFFLCGLFLGERSPQRDKEQTERMLLKASSAARWTSVNPVEPLPIAGPDLQDRRLKITGRVTLAAWVLLPPLTVYLISRRVPIFEDRYLIYITPAFYLLIGLGVLGMQASVRWLASFCLGLVLAINLVGIWHQQRQPLKADFRAAAAYLSGQPQRPSAIMIQIPYLQHTFKYYYRAKYKLLEGLWTNDGKTEAAVDTEMAALTVGLSDLWLVVSEEDLWDRRHLTRTWLNQNADLIDQAHFVRIDLYHYQFRPGTIEQQSIGKMRE